MVSIPDLFRVYVFAFSHCSNAGCKLPVSIPFWVQAWYGFAILHLFKKSSGFQVHKMHGT